jgi:hypothetical protein
MNGKYLINQVIDLTENDINLKLDDNNFINEFKLYCMNDFISLYHILLKFN